MHFLGRNTMSLRRDFIKLSLGAALGAGMALSALPSFAQGVTLLNVSYDPTRELYVDYNQAFAKYWKAKTGQDVTIKQSHGGSGKQARSIIDGLDADVATLALAYDIDEIAEKAKIIAPDWQKRVRHWGDLVKPGVSVVTANPKTSGGARWGYLAAYGYALRQPGASDAKARDFIAKLFRQVPVLDSGARGATVTFADRGIGDVLLAWENEAHLALKEFGADKFEIVYPPTSILAEPPVAVVDKVVDKRGTRKVAEAYLEYLYSPVGQEIAAKNFYRPIDDKVAAKYAAHFPKIALFTIDDVFGGWTKAQKTH